MIGHNCNLINAFYLLIVIISSSACENKSCYKIRNWEVQEITGKKFHYIDTFEYSEEYPKMKQLDIILNTDTLEYLIIGNSIYSLESSNSIV